MPRALRPLRKAGPFVVHNDPEQGPHWFDVTGVRGDRMAASVLSFPDDGAGVHRVIATRRRGEPGAVPWVVQAQDVDIVDADAVEGDGASCGRVVRSRPAPRRAGARCVETTCPPTGDASHDAAGRYRVYVRARKTDPGAQAEMWLTRGERNVMPRDRVRIHKGPELDWWYYDLGLAQVNGGGGPVRHDNRTRGELPVMPLPIALHVRDLDGEPGGVEFDHFVFLPADEAVCDVETRPTGVASTLVVDGRNDRTYRLNEQGALLPGGASHSGAPPLLAPKGATTRIFVLSGLYGGAPAPLDGTTEVLVEYQAKHYSVAPYVPDEQ